MSDSAKKWKNECLAAVKEIEGKLGKLKNQLLLVDKDPYVATEAARRDFQELRAAVDLLQRKFRSDTTPGPAQTPA